jgi:hypothetical protein
MNKGIKKLMREKESVKEGYDRRSLRGRGIILLGEEDIFLWKISLWGSWGACGV